MNDRAYSFLGGAEGPWEVIRICPVVGDSLPEAPRLLVTNGLTAGHNSTWVLRGVTSDTRLVPRRLSWWRSSHRSGATKQHARP
jgi:hypothetical protein